MKATTTNAAKNTRVYKVLRQDIDQPGGFGYLGRFTGDVNMSSTEQIATAKAMFPFCASPVVSPERV